MDFHDWNQRFSSFESSGDDVFWGKSNGDCRNADEEKGELVVKKKIGLLGDDKALAALKSHSEAERRRRERINAHLDTLRGLVPCSDKMDKATLLAQVIRQVKHLKVNATQAATGLLVPQDADEVKVEKLDQSLTFRTSFCCKHTPGLLTDLRQALISLKVDITRAELSTLGDRVKVIFEFSSNGMTSDVLLSSVRKALTSVVEKRSISPEYSPRTTLPNKRMRYSL